MPWAPQWAPLPLLHPWHRFSRKSWHTPRIGVRCGHGGGMFGDNLSFISDTTIAATRTQGVKLKDKFKANLIIALPAALITIAALFLLR